MHCIKSVLLAVAATILLGACSSDNNQEKEKGKIEAMTEQAGQEAAQAIKAPIEKAESAADMADKRVKDMAEQKQE